MRFADLIEQTEAIDKVRETIRSGRLAHALLLTGPSGIGKLAFATALAQYVNCLQPIDGDSCGRCNSCLKISKAAHPDLRYILPVISKLNAGKRMLSADFFEEFRKEFTADPYYSFETWQRSLGGDNKQLFISVHEIRDLKRSIYLKAFEAQYKVVIVWNAEYINIEGANAFLKLLEEPPDRALILMTCSDPSQLLTTINSRCQRLQLRRISTPAIQGYLTERHQLDPAHALDIAQVSEGSLGSANEYLSESNLNLSKRYVDWLRAIYLGDYQKITDQTEPLARESKEYQKLFLMLAMRKLRDSYLYHLGTPQLALVTGDEQAFHEKFSQLMDTDKVARMAREMERSLNYLSGNAHAQMVFSALSLRMHGILRE